MSTVSGIENLDPDPVIHPIARLKIMTLLAGTESLGTEWLGFVEIKERLRMTDGNLCVHMRTLEENGYVSVRKSFINRKPRTEYSLTPQGREAFKQYCQALKEIITQAQPAEPSPAAAREGRPVLRKGMAPAK